MTLCSGCGTVDSVVASNTRGPGFEYSQWQFSLNNFLLLTVKTKIKKIARYYKV